MRRKVVCLFSGQGSHYYGMGRDLFESHVIFRNCMQALDRIFHDLGLRGILAEIYRVDRTPADWFSELRFTHPAIFMVEVALLEVLRAEGIEPDCVVGASLGEFAAAVASGAISKEEVASSIVRQVEIVEKYCPAGGMLAVFEDVGLFAREEILHGNAELAAINHDRHFVVSGIAEPIEQIGRWLNFAKVPFQKLAVAYPFHSRFMDVAAEPYRECLTKLRIGQPRVPFVSCETASYLDSLQIAHFWHMVRSPIRLRDTIQMLEQEAGGCLYIDMGPSGTLANFVKYNQSLESRSKALTILSPFAGQTSNLKRVKQAYAELAAPVRSPAITNVGMHMKAYVFPGQGSQSLGMGKELFREFPEITAQADRILDYSIEKLCNEDPNRQLDQTQYTQPALFIVNALSYERKVKQGTARADFLAGHSLGEYNALHAAGAFDFATGLQLVKARGAFMAQVREGGMAAVVGLDEPAVVEVLKRNDLQDLDLANCNGAKQFILAGPQKILSRAETAFRNAGAQTYLPLRVSGAFHSRYMRPAQREFERFIAQFKFQPLRAPVLANVTGQPYENGQIGQLLVEQLTNPVRWDLIVRFLLGQGEMDIEEVGPGNVLSKLLAKVRQQEAAPRFRPADSPTSVLLTERTGANRAGGAPEKADRAELSVPSVASASGAAPAFSAVESSERIPGRYHPASLGSAEFRRSYGTKYAYVCGSMYRGIASEELVIRAAQSGILAYFGTGGLELPRIESAITKLRSVLRNGEPYGLNLVHNPTLPAIEVATVELFIKHGVRNVEAAAFMQMTPALVLYRLKGSRRTADGVVNSPSRIMAKVSRPEVAEAFLSAPPERIVQQLLSEGKLTADEARLAAELTMADDICVEADSGGHTDQGNLMILLPTLRRLRDRLAAKNKPVSRVRVGAAGGIGTSEAAAAAFLLGADFILTGSINQCTVEAAMSPVVKDMLSQINIQDTDYAPAGDMFEIGSKVQVLKKGVFFPGRARKLHELYRQKNSLDEIDAETRKQIEQRYFKKTFEEVYREARAYFADKDQREIDKAEKDPKHRMALVFRWYFGYSQSLAMNGDVANRVDFQVHCGPALGAFNQWVKGTELEQWQNRHVDTIAEKLMVETANHLNRRYLEMT